MRGGSAPEGGEGSTGDDMAAEVVKGAAVASIAMRGPIATSTGSRWVLPQWFEILGAWLSHLRPAKKIQYSSATPKDIRLMLDG